MQAAAAMADVVLEVAMMERVRAVGDVVVMTVMAMVAAMVEVTMGVEMAVVTTVAVKAAGKVVVATLAVEGAAAKAREAMKLSLLSPHLRPDGGLRLASPRDLAPATIAQMARPRCRGHAPPA